jgi:two-component system response regulator HydG
MPDTLLLVAREPAALHSLYRILKRDARTVLTAATPHDALQTLGRETVAVGVLDLHATGTDGLELLVRSRAAAAAPEWVVLLEAADVPLAVAALRAGAREVLVRPCDAATIEAAVVVARNHWRAVRAAKSADPVAAASPLLGGSECMRAVQALVDRVGPSVATVLVQGESGTGKEVVATALQQRSNRRDAPFIKVNCAAIPEALMESELFGHEKGAFTGAVRAKKGRFELADGGTIFLDEIGDMSANLQMKLLRVLQEGEFDRVGGTRPVRVDVRVVAATNIELERAVAEKRFREDLYYRLRVIQIDLPPLRARKEDIPLLVEHFVRRYAAKNDKPITGLEADAMAALLEHPWPGNVRELENTIERAVVLAHGTRLRLEDLAPEMRRTAAPATVTFTLGTTLAEIERRMIAETLRHTLGDKVRAAALLGITARTIYRKLEQRRRELRADAEASPKREAHRTTRAAPVDDETATAPVGSNAPASDHEASA